ncbi:MAG: tetratricopeptide repeat protein [Acidobacteriota bacterium]
MFRHTCGPILAAALLAAPELSADSVLAGSAAVLPFTNATPPAPINNANPSVDWIGESIAEALRESLSGAGLPALARADVAAAYADLRLRDRAELTQASVLKLGQALNADQVIYGTYRLESLRPGETPRLIIEAHMADRARVRQNTLPEESGPMQELDRLESHLAWQTLRLIAPDRARAEGDAKTLRPAVLLSAEEAFVRGLLTTALDQKEKYFLQAARLDPHFARPNLEMGKIELARKKYAAAAEWLLKVEAANLHSAEASFYLGVAKFRQADYAAAQAAFQQVAEKLPAAEVFNNLGVAESRRNQLHALTSFGQALEVNPNHPDYHFNMGYILWKTGQFEAAADRFRAVLDRDPMDQMATLLLGRSLQRQGLRKGNPADLRLEELERFKDSYEELASKPH